jgi:glycosyltransferase involved in cell wall biosynthesis
VQKLPKISIVTPSYNQGKFLESTLKSVLEQDYPNFEYVVIDGGSNDNSLSIIKKYQKKLKYFESKKDRGQSHAINKGFAKTDGEIMAWINSDDMYRPGTLRLVASIFANFPEVEWLTCLPSTMNEDGYQIYLAQPPLYIRSFIQKGWYTKKLMGFIMQEGTFWRRSLWKKTGGKLAEVPYSMDMKLWQSFAKHTQLYCVQTCWASYRLNPNRKNNDNHKKYYKEMKALLPEKISLIGKIIWRQIAKIANHSKLFPAIYFDQNKLEWRFRKNLFNVKTFELLSHTRPRKF